MVRSSCQRMEHLVKTYGLWLAVFSARADDFFGVAEAVDGGGIDPVDAEVEGAVNGRDGFAVILRAPGEFPVAAADRPCAKANRSEFQI